MIYSILMAGVQPEWPPLFEMVLGLLVAYGFVGGFLFWWHRSILRVEKMTLLHADDEITLDDDKIRLVKADGTQTTLPRKDLKIQRPYYADGRQIFTIGNPQLDYLSQIILTSDMENAKELVETIQPGTWDLIANSS